MKDILEDHPISEDCFPKPWIFMGVLDLYTIFRFFETTTDAVSSRRYCVFIHNGSNRSMIDRASGNSWSNKNIEN